MEQTGDTNREIQDSSWKDRLKNLKKKTRGRTAALRLSEKCLGNYLKVLWKCSRI